MNISCVICSDVFLPHSEVYSTQCGHMFHFMCLMNWIERAKTCPQCRNKSTEKTIHRIYFNLANTDHILEDVGTLQNRIDNMQFKITMQEKDIKTKNEKFEKSLAQNKALRLEITDLENKSRVTESAIHALKEQISFFKSKAKEVDRLSEEVSRLRTRIRDLENVQMAIDGTREQVNDMLRNEHNVESLAILAATLKKSLLDAEGKKRNMEYKLKQAQNDATKYRREVTVLECQNSELKKELVVLKKSWENEKSYLKHKISDMNKRKLTSNDESSGDLANNSIQRIMMESPIPMKLLPKLNPADEIIDLDSTYEKSPSIPQKVKKITDSDSPYLSVKSSNVGINYGLILNSKFSAKPTSTTKFTIFKSQPTTINEIKIPKKSSDAYYDGLGGSSKDHTFPSPKPLQTGLKRHKSATSISSSKFRKLAPTKSRVTNFLSQETNTLS